MDIKLIIQKLEFFRYQLSCLTPDERSVLIAASVVNE